MDLVAAAKVRITGLLKGHRVQDLIGAKSPVVKNFFSLSLLQLLNYSLPLITLPYVVRTIGLDNYGKLVFASAFIQYLIILTNYGFNLSAPRDVSIHKGDPDKLSRIFTAILIAQVALMLLSLAILCGALMVSARMRASEGILLIYFSLVVSNVLSMTWLFQGIERMHYITYLNLLSKALYALCLFSLVRKPSDYLLIPALSGGTELLSSSIGVLIVIRRFGIRLTAFSWEELVTQCRRGLHIFISTIAINAYTATPTFAIGLFTDARITGLYSVAERLANMVQMFPLSAFLQSFYPRLSAIFAKAPSEAYRLTTLLQRITTLTYAVATPCMMLLAPAVIRLVTGHAHHEAVVSFRLLAVSVLCINSNSFRILFLLVSAQHRLYARIHIVSGIAGGAVIFLSAYWLRSIGPPLGAILIDLVVLVWTIIETRKRPLQSGATRQPGELVSVEQ
jgi:PST family polysaccharide transporter